MLLTRRAGLYLPAREILRAYDDQEYERWIGKKRAPFQSPFVNPAQQAAVSVVQFVNGTDAAAAGTTVVASITPAVNAFLHFYASCDSAGGADFTAISSVPALAWTALDNIDDATNQQRGRHWTSSVASNAAYTITATCTSTTFRYCAVKEIGGSSGYDSAAAAHNGNLQAAPGTGGDGVTSNATPTLTSQPALISGWVLNIFDTTSPNAGTGFTSDGSGFGTPNAVRGESKRVTATTGVAATFTATTNEPHSSVVAIFLEGSALAQTYPKLERLARGAMRGMPGRVLRQIVPNLSYLREAH